MTLTSVSRVAKLLRQSNSSLVAKFNRNDILGHVVGIHWDVSKGEPAGWFEQSEFNWVHGIQSASTFQRFEVFCKFESVVERHKAQERGGATICHIGLSGPDSCVFNVIDLIKEKLWGSGSHEGFISVCPTISSVLKTEVRLNLIQV